ncbi:SDR family oxidoreductase [Rhizobium leguminosarum]|uniref:Putative oxidoreductase n=1 Tax=Rhizobium leguminosarum TaxID=384 RepID=A0A2K9Z8X1_RHILE|nr:SDR family oxidoreductase [Rhizobium leguminosarum]AUW44630.1 putative oxidoreductase [Rhizobium leguminosarum]
MAGERTIVVTGCSSGIGAHCARALKADGWRVFATVRKPDDLKGLEAEGIEAFLMDYARTETISDLVGAVLERSGGRIDALFNNGAYGQPGAVEDLSTATLRAQFEANFFGWHELTRQVIPPMRKRGAGRIVQCSSILGIVPYRYRGAYTASKFALEGLSITLRMELQGSGIHVSLIEPGPIATRFTANALAKIKEHVDLENSPHAGDYISQLARLDGSGPVSRHKLGPEAVYSVLKHALNSKNPRPHYPVTTPAKQGMFLKRLLPADLFYRLMRWTD